jgi:ribosomal protein S18 acetylase RimI-like enzyme
MHVEPQAIRSREILALVKAGMKRHTKSFVPWEGYSDLTIVALADDGFILGAALGETGRGWLHISAVFVDEQYRRRQLGTQLMQAAETEAQNRGCFGAYLDTFSYQARPFFEKLGYIVFGTLDDYPVRHQRYYMRKLLNKS